MAGSLEGKVALVTGGSSGIGRASALAFVREGAKVVVADVDIAGGEETLRRIKEMGGEAILVRADVSSATDVEAMVKHPVETFGRVDCAFNNAGISVPVRGPMHEFPEEMWDRVVSINMKGVWLCMKYEMPHMLLAGGGTIVNTASIMGLVGSPTGNMAYNASKHAVVGMTKTAAIEYAQSGIRVNAVCPGYILTPLVEQGILSDPGQEEQVTKRHPMGRLGKPEEIAESVVWLCSDAASFVTGHTMTIDGGYVAQ